MGSLGVIILHFRRKLCLKEAKEKWSTYITLIPIFPPNDSTIVFAAKLCTYYNEHSMYIKF